MLAYYLDVFFINLRNNLARELHYRTNFLTRLSTEFIWMGIEFLFFEVLYHQVPLVAGWTQQQTYFFLGVFITADSLFTIFMERNFWYFGDLVNKGELDILLLKPCNPVFMVLTRFINFSNVFVFCMGLYFMHYYGSQIGLSTLILFLKAPFWLIVGFIAACEIRFLMSILVFWIERGFALNRLYYQLFTLATKPEGLYPPLLGWLIKTILPFAFIASVPARALATGLTLNEIIGTLSVLGCFHLLNLHLWSKALSRYQSASS